MKALERYLGNVKEKTGANKNGLPGDKVNFNLENIFISHFFSIHRWENEEINYKEKNKIVQCIAQMVYSSYLLSSSSVCW
jgi:hypothetical protein